MLLAVYSNCEVAYQDMEDAKSSLLQNDHLVPPPGGQSQRLVPPPQPEQRRSPVEKKKKKKKPPPFMYFVCRRTLLLGTSLYLCQVIALSIFCNGFFGFWDIPGPLVFLSCSRENFEKLNGTGHPFCYKRCSPYRIYFLK